MGVNRLGRKGSRDRQQLSLRATCVLIPAPASCLGMLVRNDRAKNRRQYLFGSWRCCVRMRMNGACLRPQGKGFPLAIKMLLKSPPVTPVRCS